MATVTNHQTVKTVSRIFHIGLEMREVLVIKSMFQIAPELSESFVFGEPTENDPADLMFINADDPAAMARWQTLKKEQPACVGIMVSSADNDAAGEKVIRKPLMYRKFVELLHLITSTETHSSVKGGSAKTLNVLVVDDSFPARQYMRFKLEEIARNVANLEIDFAESGEKALEMIGNKNYDIAFLDVVMPGMDGYTICRKMKQQSKARVAMLTGQSTKVDRARGSLAGCDDYLMKPPVDDELRSVLSKAAH